MALDHKEITAVVEDGLKKNRESILQEVKAGNTEVIEKANRMIDEVSKKVDSTDEKFQKQFDELATSIKMDQKAKEKPLNFKQALAASLKENHSSLLENIKNGQFGRAIELKNFNYTDFTNYEGFATDYSQTPIVNPYSSFHYRNIIPLGTTDKEILSYPREGVTTGAAGVWEHAGDAVESKPEMAPSFAPYTTNVQWIAGLVKGIPVSMLEDLPWLTSFLQTKAMNELMKAEDLQIQDGPGTGANLSGFFTAGNSNAYVGSYTVFVEQLIDAAYRQIADFDYMANRIVISNADRVSILLNKETGAGYTLPAGTVSVVNGVINMAGLEVYSTSYLNQGDALIGDFNEAQFVIRSAPRLRFFEQNEDDATKNQIMARIEERVALAIFSPNAFVTIQGT